MFCQYLLAWGIIAAGILVVIFSLPAACLGVLLGLGLILLGVLLRHVR